MYPTTLLVTICIVASAAHVTDVFWVVVSKEALSKPHRKASQGADDRVRAHKYVVKAY